MSYCNYKAKDKYIMGHGSFIHICMKQAFMQIDIKQKVGNIGLRFQLENIFNLFG
jgi:hypothetical protein